MEGIKSIENEHGKDLLKMLRGSKINEAERALGQDDFMIAMNMFEAAAFISRTIGDGELGREFSVDSMILKDRLGIPRTSTSIYATPSHSEGTSASHEISTRDALSWTTYLASLQRGAAEAFSRKNYHEARYHVIHMVAIAKRIGNKKLISNYNMNLARIDAAIEHQQPYCPDY